MYASYTPAPIQGSYESIQKITLNDFIGNFILLLEASIMKFLLQMTISRAVKENANFFLWWTDYNEFSMATLKLLNILQGISKHATHIHYCF